MTTIADLTPDEFIRLMGQAIAGAGGSSGPRFGGGGTQPSNGPVPGPDYAKIAKDAEAFAKRLRENTKDANSWSKALKGQQQHFRDVSEDLKELDEKIKETDAIVDSAARDKARNELQAARAAVANAAALDNNKKIVANFGAAMVSATSVVFAGAGKLTKSLQGSGSGMELATEMMGVGIDVANAGAQAAGGAMSSAGKVMQSSTNPKIKALGTVADIAGGLLGGMGDAASKLAKFGIDVLSKEVEKTVKAFNTAATSGAMFADGMTGLRNASNDAGLTVDQFAGVLQKHSVDLAATGLGVAEGAKAVGRVSKDLKASGVAAQLQKLGFGFEEQAGLIAETTANMRRSTGGQSSDAEIATQTAKYADSLRTIAAITGEDAKKKTEEAKAQNQILAFQQQMAEKTPAQRAAIDAAMATMTEQEKKNFRDRAVFGEVINKEGAIYEATLAGAREKGEAQKALLDSNNMTAEANAKLNAQYGDQIRTSAMNQKELGMAAMVSGGAIEGVGKAMLDATNQAGVYSEKGVQAGIDSVQAQKNATDKLTEGVMGAESAAQNLKLALERELTPAIGQFATVAKEMLSGVQKMLKEVGLGKGAPGEAGGDEKGVWSSIKDTVGGWNDKLKDNKALSTGLEVGGGAAMLGGAAASATGVGAIGGVPLATIGGVMSGLGMLAGALGYAEGGVATGDAGGYLEKLHGTELIVPMSGGELKKDSKGYAELMKMMGSDSTVRATIPSAMGTNTTNDMDDLASLMLSSVTSNMDQKVGNMLSGITSGLEDVGPKVMQAAMNPLGTAMDAISSFMAPKSKEDKITDVGSANTSDSMAELVAAISMLVSSSEAQLTKQDDMLRAMQDTKDYTERLYNAMA